MALFSQPKFPWLMLLSLLPPELAREGCKRGAAALHELREKAKQKGIEHSRYLNTTQWKPFV